MIAAIVRRGIAAVLTVLVVLSFVFFVVRLTGDPTSYLLPFDYTDEQKAALEEELGTDKPLIQQYGIFMGDVMQGDLGYSHRWRRDALGMVMDALPETVKLATVAFVISVVISVPLGVIAAANRGSLLDSFAGMIATAGQAMPNFVLAVLLISVFAVELRWLPVGGTGSWKSYILPGFTLASFSIASQTRIVRSAVSDTLSQDYIRTARAKGLTTRSVLFRHALRSSLVPILTIVGLQWAQFLGGSVVIETIFTWPGVGRLMVDAVSARDFAVVQSAVVVLSTLFILVNVITDVAYVVADPRVRSGGGL